MLFVAHRKLTENGSEITDARALSLPGSKQRYTQVSHVDLINSILRARENSKELGMLEVYPDKNGTLI